MATASDDFARSDEIPLASPWTTGQGGFSALELVSTRTRAQAANAHCVGVYTSLANSGSVISEVEMIFVDTNSEGWCGAATMVSSSVGNAYVAYASYESQQIKLVRLDDGVETVLWTEAATLSAGVPAGTLRLTSSGGTHTVTLEGVAVGSPASDATYTSGGSGVALYIASNVLSAQHTAWNGANAITTTMTADAGALSVTGQSADFTATTNASPSVGGWGATTWARDSHGKRKEDHTSFVPGRGGSWMG